jgi:poly-gamma-glutamate capsule biosynthesis protein CapA/YwtB (metallophosphatase superfamily)
LSRALAALALACAVIVLAPSAAARPHAPGTFTFAAVGDIVMGSMPNLPPDDGAGFFRAVSPDLSAEIVLGNLEGTLSTNASAAKCATNCFAFHTPPSYARWLKQAGFTVMNVANNHALDFGPAGQAQTLDALRKVGLAWTGRPGEIDYQQVGGIRVALLGFAPYPWAQSLTDIPAAVALVRDADAEADVVIVTMHAGAEGVDHQHVTPGMETYLGELRGNPIAFAHAVVSAGADLVVGSGPHVLRGMEWYKGRLIAYSMGNFGGYGVFRLGGPLSASGILRVTLRADGSLVSGHLVATRLTAVGIPALDPSGAARRLVRSLSREDLGSRAVTVSPTGRLGHP